MLPLLNSAIVGRSFLSNNSILSSRESTRSPTPFNCSEIDEAIPSPIQEVELFGEDSSNGNMSILAIFSAYKQAEEINMQTKTMALLSMIGSLNRLMDIMIGKLRQQYHPHFDELNLQTCGFG
jgi:hypothetical protein